MKMLKYILFFVSLGVFINCKNKEKSEEEAIVENHTGYAIEPVNIQNVKLNDEFWLPIIQQVQEKTIEYALAKCEEEGRFDNFLIAGGERFFRRYQTFFNFLK